jgi:hypothetical protein
VGDSSGQQTSLDYPIQQLLFFLDSDFDDSVVAQLHAVVVAERIRRNWTLGPPTFIDDTDSDGLRTVGGILRLYSALPPWGERLPLAIDRALLEEVRHLIKALARFSAESGVDIGFEVDGEAVGWIAGGEADESLAVGFIGEWGSHLESRHGR